MMQLLQLRHDELLQCVVGKFQRRYFRVVLGLFSVAEIVVIICGARGCKYVPTDVLFYISPSDTDRCDAVTAVAGSR